MVMRIRKIDMKVNVDRTIGRLKLQWRDVAQNVTKETGVHTERSCS